jgi:predicted alpha/beta hydrolase family esterase
MTTFILPGLGNSGPEHWQSYWEREDPSCRRVMQAEWDAPRIADWVRTLSVAITDSKQPIALVAHSSSCALVAHWARAATAEALARVRGALLVAPSDPDGPNYPSGPIGFAPMPLDPLPFPSIVVASTDDIYISLAQARVYANAWGSSFVNVGAAGHINSASGLGRWAVGHALLAALRDADIRAR